MSLLGCEKYDKIHFRDKATNSMKLMLKFSWVSTRLYGDSFLSITNQASL